MVYVGAQSRLFTYAWALANFTWAVGMLLIRLVFLSEKIGLKSMMASRALSVIHEKKFRNTHKNGSCGKKVIPSVQVALVGYLDDEKKEDGDDGDVEEEVNIPRCSTPAHGALMDAAPIETLRSASSELDLKTTKTDEKCIDAGCGLSSTENPSNSCSSDEGSRASLNEQGASANSSNEQGASVNPFQIHLKRSKHHISLV